MVDDDQQIRKLLGRYLAEQNFRVPADRQGARCQVGGVTHA
ncbi:MAG: DNA-binding response regulator, partial [Starkeya sp.]|nr:DNA-binding response regulator [Starkeya sp.]